MLNLGVPDIGLGAHWGADGMITFGSASGLRQVPSAGGAPRPLTNGNGAVHRLPDLLPGGRGVLFDTVAGPNEYRITLYATAGSEYRDLVPAGVGPRYSPTGHLVYAQAGTLFAARFDLNTLNVTGDPTPVLQGVLQTNTRFPYYSFSTTGTLVYVSGDAGTARNLVWVARNGTEQLLTAPPPASSGRWPTGAGARSA